MAVSFNRDLGKSFEVLGIRANHDVHVLRSPDHPPGIDREAADQDEIDTRLRESAQNLIEGRRGQLERAAPVNRIN
jgi:hypothetical protein